ncbi:MAG: ADOP family duplicated permease [Bryobacteraceae bacterium]|nr:ADOP family duplicated permease [Bryobacteraceae bacterium]
MGLLRRLGFLLRRGRMERELAEEMAAHREMMGIRGEGFGNGLRLREEAADVYGWAWLDRVRQDVSFGLRLLKKSPVFTLCAVLILAIGIGVNLSGFQVLNVAIFTPVPVKDPHTIISYSRRSPQASSGGATYPHLDFLRRHARTVSAVMAYRSGDLTFDGGRRVSARFVTGNWFTEIGGEAAAGRVLNAERDDDSRVAPVAVLSHSLWTAEFGSDPAIVGRIVRLNGKPVTVVGVAAFAFVDLKPSETDLWLPLEQEPALIEGSGLRTSFEKDVTLFARLAGDSTPGAAEEEARALMLEMKKIHPNDIWDGEWLPVRPGAYMASIDERERAVVYPVIGLASALVLCVLTVACANLGNLMLARALGRAREFSIRAAVGASRGRLIRQLLTESLLLAALGTAAGIGLSYWGGRYMLAATGAPRFLNPAFDWRVGLVSAGLSVVAVLVFGFMPALQATRTARSKSRLRGFFVGAQVAACCLLLVMSSLLVRGLVRALTVDPGFDTVHTLTVQPALGEHGYRAESARAYFDELRQRLSAAPGVAGVAAVSLAPLGNRMATTDRPVRTVVYDADPNYFEVMRIPIRRGRRFGEGETGACVVSESFAQRVWPGEDPLGKEFPGRGGVVVVGVAADARTVALRDSSTTEAYFPTTGGSLRSSTMVVRAEGRPESIAAAVEEISRNVDPRVRPDIELVRNNLERKTESARSGALIVSCLGVMALLLAAVGVYGIAAYTVTQQTRDIGIRVAIGAPAREVLRVAVGGFRMPVFIGAVCGLGLAAAFSAVLRRELFGVSPLDPVSYAGAVGVFGAVAAVALIGPVRRALRIAPAQALRYE